MDITRLSSKGQIVIPQAIRTAHKWRSGLEFTVIETKEGILLTPVNPFQPTLLKNVIGCTNYKGVRKSLKDMQAGIAKGAKERR